MKKYFLQILIPTMLFGTGDLFAQHEHHPTSPQKPVTTTTKPAAKKKKTAPSTSQKKPVVIQPAKDTIPTGHDMHSGHDMTEVTAMSHTYSLYLPMNRNGSGTSWVPDESPMHMYMTGKKTMWMFHGNVFLRYANADILNSGSRGASKLDAPNWFMAMMNKPVGKKGLFSAKAMISLDPLTEGGDGYPLLFQSGETHNGKRLVDRQHPHDLFSELSMGYSYAINKRTDVFAYFGYPGEPALSAPAFMHRVSAANNPDAPLGHHWQDATHITFGVGTLGLRYENFKVEASIFTGREPNEERYGFDEPFFDSYSYRLSFNPSTNWALQFSQGFIKGPELLEPGVDVTRTTASTLYSINLSSKRHLDAALIWGVNDRGEDLMEHSLLLENNYQIGKNALFSRFEFIQKSTEELDLENEFGEKTFNVYSFALGYNRSICQKNFIELAAGLQTTLNFPSKELKPLYGNLPVGFQVYLQFKPSLHRH